MENKRIVDIKLHPLSWRVLRDQYAYDGIAVDLGHGWLYNMATLCLRRHPVMAAWEFNRMPQGMVDGRIYITDYDSQRYGDYMSLAKQATLSVVIFRQERERLCQLVATAHVMAGVSRDTAMRYFLDKAGYEDYEISFAALRKHYQRHYRHFEDNIFHDFNELNATKRTKANKNLLANCP